MSLCRTATLAALSLTLAQAASANPVIYSQPWDGTPSMFASQNDTAPGGIGNFATVYDDFTFTATHAVTDVHWTGGYFNPSILGVITAFKISFHADTAGQPGAAIYTATVAGNASETPLGVIGGFPMSTYSLDLPTEFLASADTRYWISVVPDLPFPPQWGMASGTGGNGVAFQDFSGLRLAIADLAFDLTGVLPEPGSLPIVALALIGLVGLRRWAATT